MKILVVSDSHGNTSALLSAVYAEAPELILHLGDHEHDCASLRDAFPDIPLRAVRGNCDRVSMELDDDEFVIAGKRFFMTHGHLFGVKHSLDSIVDSAYVKNADILLFGHTHNTYYAERNGLVIINPGSIGTGKKTYAVLVLENGAQTCVFGSADS